MNIDEWIKHHQQLLIFLWKQFSQLFLYSFFTLFAICYCWTQRLNEEKKTCPSSTLNFHSPPSWHSIYWAATYHFRFVFSSLQFCFACERIWLYRFIIIIFNLTSVARVNCLWQLFIVHYSVKTSNNLRKNHSTL